MKKIAYSNFSKNKLFEFLLFSKKEKKKFPTENATKTNNGNKIMFNNI